MRLIVAAVGRPRNAALASAIGEYEIRAARYWPLDVHEVRDEKQSQRNPDDVLRLEGAKLMERTGDARLIVCDERGDSYTSVQFADLLQREREGGKDLAIVIGGAFGLHESVLDRSHERLAIATWTLPHELARLVLAEQLYRAGTILRGEPYHK